MENKKCEKLSALAMSGPSTSLMMAAIYEAQGPNERDTPLVKCRRCLDHGVEGGARAFLEAPPMSIVLCSNRLHSEKDVQEALTHELIHAYDHQVTKRDLTQCHQLAYSEIRAAREAECAALAHSQSWLPQTMRVWFLERCVRDTATQATRALFPTQGGGCVADVFREAYADHSPSAPPAEASAAGARATPLAASPTARTLAPPADPAA